MELVNKYMEYLRYEKNCSSHTEISYFNDLKQFSEFLKKEYPNESWTSVKPVMVRQWMVALIEAKNSPRTVNRKLSALKAFYRFLQLKNYIQLNKINKISGPKTSKKLPTFVLDNDINQLLEFVYSHVENFVDFRNVLILEMFYFTGMRRAELIGIRDTDIDSYNRTILVNGKRNKQRLIPISQVFLDRIREYQVFRDSEIDCPQALFVRENGTPLYPKMVYNIVVKQLEQIPTLSKMSPHVLRHTFATSMLNSGADINAVKELLGHASLAATEIYTHTSLDELKNIYKRAHPREEHKKE